MGLSFEGQLHYENEGAAAALRGVSRDACPYSREAQPGPWNHWVYGHDIALSEKQIIETGTISWYSTSSDLTQPVKVQQLAEAIREGTWKPRFHPMPACSTLPTSSGKKP